MLKVTISNNFYVKNIDKFKKDLSLLNALHLFNFKENGSIKLESNSDRCSTVIIGRFVENYSENDIDMIIQKHIKEDEEVRISFVEILDNDEAIKTEYITITKYHINKSSNIENNLLNTKK